jgi:hypothetical protein
MNDPQGDAAIEEYSKANNGRVVVLNKSGVFLARNDRRRQNPIRNPRKNSHDEGPPESKSFKAPYAAASNYENSYPQDTRRLQPPGPYGFNDGSTYVNSAPAPSAVFPYSHSHSHHVPAAPPEQYSYATTNSHVFFDGNVSSAPPPQPPYFQSFQLSTKVLLENLPLSATPDDISACLYQYSLNVLSCVMEYDNNPTASWCYAHIDLANSEESSRCVALAQQSLLEYRGRILTASIETNFSVPIMQAPPPIMNHPPPSHHNNTHSYQQFPRAAGYPRTPPPVGPGGPNFRRGSGRGRHRQQRRDRPY